MVRNTLLCRSSRDRRHIEFSWYAIVVLDFWRWYRAIHEQALQHHFDPNKKGEKFDYQRQFPNQETKPRPELGATLTELEIPKKTENPKSPKYTFKSSSRRDEATSAVVAVKGRQTDTYGIGVNSAECSGRHRKLVEPSFSTQSDGAGENLLSVSGEIKG